MNPLQSKTKQSNTDTFNLRAKRYQDYNRTALCAGLPVEI